MDGRHHLRPLSSHHTTKTVIFSKSDLKCATLSNSGSAVEVLLHLLRTRIAIMGRLPFCELTEFNYEYTNSEESTHADQIIKA